MTETNHVKRTLLSAISLTLIASLSQAAPKEQTSAPAAAAQALRGSGVDQQHIDPAMRAQDDFFQYLNGKWLKAAEIPADKASWGAFEKLHDDTQPILRAIIEKSAGVPHQVAGSDAQRIGDFYASFMDEARLETLGMTPLQPTLAKIGALKDKAELPALFAELSFIGVNLPYDVGIDQDSRDSTKYAAIVSQGGLGLPDRDYYLKPDDAKLADALAKYGPHVERTLALAGDRNAAADARAIVAFETELARIQWTNVENRDPVKTYNKVAIAKMAAMAPGHDWQAFLSGLGVSGKVDYVIVSQPSYLKSLAGLLAKTPLETVQAYLRWHVLSDYSRLLSKAFVDERFGFYGTVLSGVTEQQPRWKRGVATVEGAVGESIGKLYVEENFPAERKARMEALVHNLLVAYRQSIDKLDWMSPATK